VSAATDVVSGAYAAFGRGDIPAILDMLAPDVNWHVPEAVPHGGSFHGPDAVGGFFEGIGERWEDFRIETGDLLEGGHEVACIGRGEGTLRGAGPASYGFAHVFTVADGKITRFREYVDPDPTILAQTRG
jgi:ketosteroid isomerase-like protein